MTMQSTSTSSSTASTQRFVQALQEARQQLEAVQRRAHEPIAIVGVGLRLPGANCPETFWDLLAAGRDMITEIPADRWFVDDYYDPQPGIPGKMYIREGGFVEAVDQFDAQFFDMSSREADSLDPQQRLLLEVAWEALERAGIAPPQLLDSQTGVFVGMTENDYARFENTGERFNVYATTGNGNHFASGRLAYLLGLQGPNMVIDTACSSSLVAIHLACQSLRLQECDLALAGGVQLTLSPEPMIATAQLNAFGADGRCKTFDAAADGFGRGEGCGLIVLKRLSDALDGGDPILAVIRGSAVNHDGQSSGLTAPNKLAQERLLRKALQNAKVQPEEVTYIEAHGTGTKLGDPIEVGALTTIFGNTRSEPLWIGSVKTNIGHLEPAAGIAGVIKVILSLQQKVIPPSLHFNTPNPLIDWDLSPVQIPTACIPWSAPKRIAGVSSFGMSGTNGHVVMAEAPTTQNAADEQRYSPERPYHLLNLSAKSDVALAQLAARYVSFLQESDEISLSDLCYTANTGRNHFSHRLSVVAESPIALAEQLETYVRTGDSATIHHNILAEHGKRPKVAFLFSGQGTQYVHMGRDLYETQPTFRKILDRCDELLRPLLGDSLLSVLYPDKEIGRQGDKEKGRQGDNAVDESEVSSGPQNLKSKIDQTVYTQPALFALEYALAELWRSWGVMPELVMGHSVGEIAAACFAGVFSLEDGLRLVAARGRLMQDLPKGDMLAVQSTESHVQSVIAPYQADVSIAAINGPGSVVISGQPDIVQAITQQFTNAGIKTRLLTVSHAFHSPMMEPILAAFKAVADTITYAKPTIPLVSNLTGQRATTEIATPEYWVRHVREAVRFADGIATLQAEQVAIYLEIGPKPTLLGLVKQIRSEVSAEGSSLLYPSLRENQNDWQPILDTLGKLYVNGVDVDWVSFDQPYLRKKVLAPTYPFQRQRHWVNTSPITQKNPQFCDPLWRGKTRLPSEHKIIFETEFSLKQTPFLADHIIFDEIIAPGAYSVSLILNAAYAMFPGLSYEVTNIVFLRPLFLFAGTVNTLQAVFTITEPQPTQISSPVPNMDFQILTFPNHKGESQDFTVYAIGRLGEVQGHQQQLMDIGAIQARCQSSSAHEEWYPYVLKKGFKLGPCFRWIDELWRGENESLGHLRMPDIIGSVDGHQIHAALLDACVISSTVAYYAEEKDVVTRLPYSWDTMRVYAPAIGNEWWCYSRRVAKNKYNFWLLDTAGKVIAEVWGFTELDATRTNLLQDREWDSWLYQIRWEPQARVRPNTPTNEVARKETDRVLIFADGVGIESDLVQRLPLRELQTIFVQVGSSFEQIDDRHYVIDGQSISDYKQVLPTQSTPSKIIYLSSLTQQDKTQLDTNHVFASTQRSCVSVLHLAQALLQAYTTPPSFYIVTNDSQNVVNGDCVNGFSQSALWGLGRTITLEHPEMRCICIDMDATMPTQDATVAFLSHLIKGDPANDRSEQQRAWRNGQQYVARLKRYQRQGGQSYRVRADGAYLISGGRGGIGLQVARWLVAQGVRHLVLLGRSKTSPDVQAVLDELTATGAQILSPQLDIADEDALAQLLATLDQPLRGVIHAAGILDDAGLLQQTPEKLHKVLSPKVQGAWNLHTLTLNQPLDFFVLFSSATSLLGTPGQANYAAANAFLDGLAAYRQKQGLPALAINWGAWDEVGMAAQQGILATLSDRGEDVIPLHKGLTLFGELVSEPAAQLGVMPIQWPRFLAHQKVPSPLYENFLGLVEESKRSPSTPDAGRPANPRDSILSKLRGALPQQRAEVLELYLRTQVAQLIGIEATSFAHEENIGFATLGLDSLTAIELRNSLQRGLACSLPVTFAFDYPTIETAMAYLTPIVLEPIAGDDTRQMQNDQADQSQGNAQVIDSKIESDVPQAVAEPNQEDSLADLLVRLSKHLE